MVDGPQDMEGWGVYSIFKEAGRLLYQQIRILRPFLLAFLLPLALTLFLEVIGIAWVLTWINDHVLAYNLGGIIGHHHHHFGFHAFHAALFKAPNADDLVPFILLLSLIYTLIFLISAFDWLLESLATAAIAKAIHHIYSSNITSLNDDSNAPETQTLTLTRSIFTSLPNAFYRIFIIALCFFVVDIFAYFLLALPFYLLSGPKYYPYHLETYHSWLWYLVFLILDFWFKISVQVSVLESQYGWAALQRSAKLVKAKVATALGLLAIYFVYFFVFDWVLLLAVLTPTHSVTVYLLAGALASVNLAIGAFWLVVVTVFYFVSKCKWSGGVEGRQAEGDLYQALDVSVEN